MAAISTVDIRSYIAQRQADTTIVRKAYDITRKDGSIVRVPEQRRSVARISNAEINRELTTLKRMFKPGDAGGQAPPQAAHSVAA